VDKSGSGLATQDLLDVIMRHLRIEIRDNYSGSTQMALGVN
jgi:hypothetical protein